MRNRSLVLTVLLMSLCLAAIGLSLSTASMQSGSPSPERSATPSERPDKLTEVPPVIQELKATEFDRLIEAAQQKGTVRVIIGLHLNFKPEGELNQAQRLKQRADIKQVQNDFLADLQAYHVADVKQFEFIPFFAAEVDAAALQRMRNNPRVFSIQEDISVAAELVQSIPIVGANLAWNAGSSGSGQAVAILDTGVEKTHSFLSGRVVSEACYSSNVAGQSVSVCPGGVTQSTAANSGLNCSAAVSGCDHGTHVAGIAAGRSAGANGVAKDANIIAIQVFSRFNSAVDCGSTPAPCARTFTSDYIKGLERVLVLNGSMAIAAANMSLGGGQFTSNCDAAQAATKTAIDNLRSVGIATVISSGNSGFTNSMGSPACISSAISVGSTNDGSLGTITDTVSSFSNSASFLNLLAPGAWINSSVPGGGFSDFSGTSMAAPHVTGAWAVLKQAAPGASVTQVLNALSSTGLSITDPRNGIVKPRIRIKNALDTLAPCNYSLSPTSLNFPSAGGSNSFNVTAGAGCSWSTTINAPSLLERSRDPQENLLSPGNDSAAQSKPNETATVNAPASPAATFTNPAAITIPSSGPATPYPSSVVASGLPSSIPGTPGSVKVTLHGFSHTFPDDVGLVLVGPTGAALNLQDGAGDGTDMVNVTYSLSDTGAAQLPDSGAWAAGTHKPTNYYNDVFPAPGPTSYQNPGPVAGGTATFSSTFAGTNPNGTWSLFVVDFVGGDSGSISGGWTLEITGGGGGGSWINISSGASGTSNGTVFYTVSSNPGGQRTGTITVNGQVHTVTQAGIGPPITRARADFDADGKSDVSVWRPSNGFWYIHHSSNINSYNFQPFGSNGDRIAPGDYDNDGRCDLAVFRPSNGTWYLQRSTLGFTGQQFGANGDIPAAGDYDGDGRTDIAVWRPTNGTFYIINSGTGQLRVEPFGSNGDKPVVGDYDGDGRADPAVFRPSNGTWYQLRSTLGFTGVPFGVSTDLPAQGDFDGDGRTDPAVFRPSNGTWYLLRSTAGFTGQQFGANGDRPAPGDFDGDAKTDLAVWRPSNGTWYMILSGTNTFRAEAFGTNGDTPITAGYIPQ